MTEQKNTNPSICGGVASNDVSNYLRQKLDCLAIKDEGIYALIGIAQQNGFSQERLYLEIAIYQSERLAECRTRLLDATLNAQEYI